MTFVYYKCVICISCLVVFNGPCWSHSEAAAQSAACHVSIKVGIQSVVKFRQQQHFG